MRPEDWALLQELFEQARALPAAEQQAFLDKHCAGHPERRAELDALLANDNTATLLATPRMPLTALAEVHAPRPIHRAADPARDQLLRGLKRHRFTLLTLLLALVAVVIVGWSARSHTQADLTASLEHQLLTVRDLGALAMESWLDEEWSALSAQAGDERLRQLAVDLLASAGDAGVDPELAKSLGAELARRLAPLSATRGHAGWALLARDGLVLAAGGDLVGKPGARLPGEYLRPERLPLVGQVFAGRRAFLPPTRPLADGDDAPIDPRSFLALMEPVLRGDGTVVAALAFVVEPRGHFSRVLETARMGSTGETYAVDGDGRLLSESRFDDELVRMGLLAADQPSALSLMLRDPGAGYLGGPLGPDHGLTRAAAALTSERGAGHDFGGYRDYRGVEVVGAWTWLAEHDFGIVTEVDVTEAHASLHHLERAFIALGALALLSLVLVLASVLAVARVDKSVSAALRLGPYTLLEVIGEGGMGTVYEGRHDLLQRKVAIKLVRADKSDDHSLKRFQREVELASRLTHPNTIEIYDFGKTEEGRFYCVMELLHGLTLQELVDDAGPLPAARVIHLLRQALGSLREAHRAGLVHRDIKPGNLELCDRGGVADVVKVLDFGLVKDLRARPGPEGPLTERISGTPLYMAPEHIRGEEVDGRADLFSLGATAWFLLTGKEAFAGRAPAEVCAAVLSHDPGSPARHAPSPVPAGLDRLICSMLAKDRDRRPADADAALSALDAVDSPPWTQAEALRFWAERGPELRQLATTRRLARASG